MAVYYYKIWEKLEQSGLTQREFCDITHISTATFHQMKKGQYVRLRTIAKIADFFKCEIGDLITRYPNTENKKPEMFFGSDSAKDLHNEFLQALKEYMDKYHCYVREIANRTTLSLNTVKKLLRDEKLSDASYKKFVLLGDDFHNSLSIHFLERLAKWESEHKTRTMTMSLHSNGDYFKEK